MSLMSWVFHDSFKTKIQAKKAGDDIVSLGFAKGVKITKTGKKSKPFMMYILPVKEREEN
jgi:hypothetical protein